jgi:hypothetical protein
MTLVPTAAESNTVKILSTIVLTAAVLGVSAVSARAASILLDQCNTVGLCNQVSVTTTLVAGAIEVDLADVAGAPVFGIFGQSGANRAFGFNVVGATAGIAFSDFSAGFGYAGAAVHGMGGGFGDFEFVINGPQQGSNAVLPLHFKVTRTGGFSSDLDLFELNAAGYLFNAHVRNNGTGITGFASSTTIPGGGDDDDGGGDDDNAVPEPLSLSLLALGVGATVHRRLRRR